MKTRRTLLLAISAVGFALAFSTASPAAVLSEVAYVAEPKDLESQSLDLYLPDDPAGAPLIVFVHSRFWYERGGGRSLASNFARALQARGVAVAIVRHRLAPAHVHPAQAEDVAAATAYLMQNAAAYGYDPKRIFLGGHASGAHLATLVALDRRYLEAAGASADAIAGVIAVSGVYDLVSMEFAEDEEKAFAAQAFPSERARKDASPIRHARADAPPMLVIVAGEDIPSVFPSSKAFSEAMRAAGHDRTEGMMVKGVNHFSILDFRASESAAREGVLELVNGKPGS